MRPPLTLCNCVVSETLAIAPQSQRHVCQILWLARSLLLQSSRMRPFRRPVSAAKNSVPDSSFGDWFRLPRGEQPVWSSWSPPSSLTEPQKPPSIGKHGVSAGIFAGLIPVFWSLWSVALAQVDFWPRSPHEKIPFPAAGFRAANGGPVELRLKELQAVGLFTCLCFLGAVIDLILN